ASAEVPITHQLSDLSPNKTATLVEPLTSSLESRRRQQRLCSIVRATSWSGPFELMSLGITPCRRSGRTRLRARLRQRRLSVKTPRLSQLQLEVLTQLVKRGWVRPH